jgi:hypothetical protein
MHCLSLTDRAPLCIVAASLLFWRALIRSSGSLLNQFSVPTRVAFRVAPTFFAACHIATPIQTSSGYDFR